MRIVITGAAGRIGSQLIAELSGAHELRLIDRRPVAGRGSIVGDLAKHPANHDGWRNWLRPRTPRWIHAFERAQVVIHLAANPDPLAPWKEVLRDNIEATWHVLETAARYQVPRVVFASSNWAVRAVERGLAPL
ncbi:MAG: NAD-dependent epimerase/dehydratase family protein, partial [Candidatus Binatia bacterium]